MDRRLIGSAITGLLTTGVVYCSLGITSWMTHACTLHKKITNERGSRPTLMVDEDLLVTKKRAFGQDRVLLTQDIEFWNFLRNRSDTHAICVRQKGVVPTGVLKQLCLNMNLPISTKPNSQTPWCNHIALKQEERESGLQRLMKRVEDILHSRCNTRPPGTTIYLRSRVETHYLPAYYNKLVGEHSDQPNQRVITLVDEIAELEFIDAKTTKPEYPFYTQGALRLSTSQRLLREPSITILQDNL